MENLEVFTHACEKSDDHIWQNLETNKYAIGTEAISKWLSSSLLINKNEGTQIFPLYVPSQGDNIFIYDFSYRVLKHGRWSFFLLSFMDRRSWYHFEGKRKLNVEKVKLLFKQNDEYLHWENKGKLFQNMTFLCSISV